jgi:Fe-S cluster assembly iron-binding protein IscA
MFLYGADIDLEDSGLNRLLKVVNPGAKMSCGCGTSFNFDPDLLDMYMGVK